MAGRKFRAECRSYQTRSFRGPYFLFKLYFEFVQYVLFVQCHYGVRGDDFDQCDIRDICPDGYKFYRMSRLHSTGGGVGVVLKDSFNIETFPSGHYRSFEYIELTLRISGFFCPPDCSVSPSWSQYIVVI